MLNSASESRRPGGSGGPGGLGTDRRRAARRLAPAAAALALALALPAAAQQRLQQSYPVRAFVIEYPLPHPEQPPVEALLAIELEMRVTRGGLMQPHPATENRRFRLGQVPPGSRFWESGLQYVSRRIIAELEERGIAGVIVTIPDLEEGTGRDLRPPGEERLRLRVWLGRIESVATVADGDRFGGPAEERTNRPEHRFVREGSPIGGDDEGLIDARAIEDYAKRLSRHPGRRVDAKLRRGELPGTARLEYHVTEHRPWHVYAQLANNGTEATTRLRERFGVAHTQMTGRDDVLRVDYVTGNFDDVHAVFGSYEGPVWRVDRLRWRVFGHYSEYDASEVGVTRLDFSGSEWEGGGRLTANLFQRGGLFVDAYGGASWRNVAVENELTIGGEADEDFFLPEVGLALEWLGAWSQGSLEAGVLWNVAEIADTGGSPTTPGGSADELSLLGREDPSRNFELLRWDGRLSFYLEPIVLWRRGWGDPGTPSRSTLAHEVVLGTRGQWAWDDRLVPQFQQVATGLYTVRGYEQSAVAADTAAIGSAEYRLHLARLLDPGAQEVELPLVGPVQLRPRTVFGRADWDLVLIGFVDAGLTWDTSSDVPEFNVTESDESLLSVGLGVELQFLRNLRAQVTVAWPRSALEDGTTPSDDPELHGVVTLLF